MNSEGLVLTACRWFFLCRMLLSCLWNSLAVLCKVASGTILVFCLQLSWAMICWWCLIYYKDAPVWLKRFLLEFQPWCRKKCSSIKGPWGNCMLVQDNENKATCSERDLRSLWRHIGQRGQYQLHILSAYLCIQRRKKPKYFRDTCIAYIWFLILHPSKTSFILVHS